MSLLREILRFFGYAFVQCYLLALFLSDFLILGNEPSLFQLPWLHCISTFSAVVMSPIIFALSGRIAPLCRHGKANIVMGCLGIAGSLTIIFSSSAALPFHFIYLGYTLTAVCCIWLLIGWQEYFATQDVKVALLGLAISTALGHILFLALTLLPSEVAAVATTALPLLAALSLRPKKNLRFYSTSHNTITAKTMASNITNDWSPRLMIVFAIVSLSYGIIRTATLPAISDGFAQSLELGGSISLAAVAACVILYLAYEKGIARVLYAAILASAIGVMLLSIPNPLSRVGATLLASCGYYLVQYLSFAIMMERAQTRKIPILGLLSLLTFAGYGGTLVGQLLMNVWPLSTERLVSICLFATIIATLLLVKAQNWVAMPKKIFEKKEQGDPDRQLMQVADSANLTLRETEVFRLWAAGHTQTFIESELCISKNTVKSHLKSIYRKTGTKNREELIRLVNSI